MQKMYINVYFCKAKIVFGVKDYDFIPYKSFPIYNNFEERFKNFKKNSGFKLLSNKDVSNISKNGFYPKLETFEIFKAPDFYQRKNNVV